MRKSMWAGKFKRGKGKNSREGVKNSREVRWVKIQERGMG
jgi:hypothetical protein